MIKWERRKNLELAFVFLFLVCLIGFILRFWHIDRLEFFTYDQARDAVYIKRLVADKIPRLLGTQTSLPGMYLPPFYYYTVAPFLWLFRLSPVGIDAYSASVGVMAIILMYYVGNRMFGFPAGIFSAAVFAVSPLNVELSRRAWNPNTLPFFILLAFYFLWRYLQKRRNKDFLYAVIVYGYCLSLHFGAWTLGPIFFGFWLFHWRSKRDGKGLILAVLAILFFVSPLIFFEIRHKAFLLSQAKIFFFDESHLSLPGANFLESMVTSLVAIFSILYSGRITLGTQAPFEFTGKLSDLFRFAESISVVAQRPFSLSFQWWGLALFVLVFGVSFKYLFKGKNKPWRLTLGLLWLWIIFGVLMTKFYAGKFFFFYYLFLFPAPFLLLGFLFRWVWDFKKIRFLVVLAGGLIFLFHVRFTTVFAGYWRSEDDMRRVAETIAGDVLASDVFNIASVRREAERWDYNAVDYQYFVETFYDRRPLDWLPQDYENIDFLYLVSEVGEVDALVLNIMEVERFGPGEVLKTWNLPNGITIYKLGKGEVL